MGIAKMSERMIAAIHEDFPEDELSVDTELS